MKDANFDISFEKIIEANKASIYRICRIYAVEPMEPQDLFQEVIFHIWKSFGAYKGDSKVSTWIYRIAINVCIRYKLNLDKHNLNTSKLSAISFEPKADQEDNDKEERFLALRSCIQNLKEANKTIVVLHLEGCGHKEIADVTGLTENHVAVKMKRIRKTLFECISTKLK